MQAILNANQFDANNYFWHDLAECQDHPEHFFERENETSDEARRRRQVAKAICAGCEVRLKCLNWAMEGREPFGIFGGRTTSERQRIRRNRLCGVADERGLSPLPPPLKLVASS